MLPKIRGVLIDLSGTVHVGEKAIPGAVEALARLRQSGIPFLFCTNTTQSSGETLASKLRGLGFNVKRDEIFTSLSACRQLVISRGLRPLLLFEPDAIQEFDGIPLSEPHDSVVIGLSPSSFHYDMLDKAFRILVQSNSKPATMIAVHKAKYFAPEPGQLSMGPGGFVEALEFASGIKAHVVGKPQKAFFELAIEKLNITSSATSTTTTTPTPAAASKESSGSQDPIAQSIVMIGDDVEQDLGGGAAELGLIRFLVQTGKYRARDEDRDAFGGLDGTFADFSAAVDHILASSHHQE